MTTPPPPPASLNLSPFRAMTRAIQKTQMAMTTRMRMKQRMRLTEANKKSQFAREGAINDNYYIKNSERVSEERFRRWRKGWRRGWRRGGRCVQLQRIRSSKWKQNRDSQFTKDYTTYRLRFYASDSEDGEWDDNEDEDEAAAAFNGSE